MIKANNLDGRCHGVGFRKEPLADISRCDELLDIGRVLGQRYDIGHLSPDGCQHRLDVFERLPDLAPHVAFTDDLPFAIERDLTLQVNKLPSWILTMENAPKGFQTAGKL